MLLDGSLLVGYDAASLAMQNTTLAGNAVLSSRVL
jgi:hypothetical protein